MGPRYGTAPGEAMTGRARRHDRACHNPRPVARARKEPPCPSGLVPPLLQLVRAHGGDAGRLLRRFRLPGDAESRTEVPVTAGELGLLLEAASGELGDPFLALRLPTELRPRTYGLAELAVRASPTLRDALQRMVRYAPLEHAPLALALEERPDAVALTCRVVGHPRGLTRHAHEYVLASALTQARALTGRAVAPRAVWFLHARPRRLEPLERFFATEAVDFGRADNGLLLDAAWLDAPLTTADTRLLATAEQLADVALRGRAPVDDLLSRVIARITEALASGADAEAIAVRLHMSKRTLQRRLDEEGTSFQVLVDQVRAQKAREWMGEGRLTLGEVAFRLGFADVTSFSRSFRRWMGVSPGRYRLWKQPTDAGGGEP